MAEVNMDQELKPNSHSYKKNEEEKKAERLTPVVDKSSLVSTQKAFGRKLLDVFMPEDLKKMNGRTVKDTLLTGLRRGFWSSMSMMFGDIASIFDSDDYGHDSYYGYSGRGSYGGRYHDYSGNYRRSSGGSSRREDRSYRSDDKVDYRHIVLDKRQHAEEVAGRLQERIEAQGYATVADLFTLVRIDTKYTDNNWGWTHPEDIRVRRIASGFLIDVTEAEYVGDR